MSEKLTEAVAELMPEGAILTTGFVVLQWIDPTGESCWRNYVIPTGHTPVTSGLGLLDFAKLDIIARSQTGLPIRYEPEG